MNLLAVGDLHLRRTGPALRMDDWFATQECKLDEIFQIAMNNDCACVAFPGDVFDRSDAPYGLVEWAIRKFKSYRDLLYLFVYGQHDLRYHTSDKQNTPLGCLVAGLSSQAEVLVPCEAFSIADSQLRVNFYGCSWGESLPDKVEDGCVNVVVMHRPISLEPVMWNHPDFLLAKDLVKKCPAQLFITGDNHVQFVGKFKRGTVVNMGSVMRTTTAQMEHKPAVAIISLEKSIIDLKMVPLQIRKNVFDVEQVEKKQVKDEKIAEFVSGLRDGFNPELRFIDNLQAAAKDAPQGVREVLDEVIG